MTSNEKRIFQFAVVGFVILGIGFPIWFYLFALPAESSNDWGIASPPYTQSESLKIINLQQKVKAADEFALRGSQLIADEKYVAGSFYYLRSLIKLPHYPITKFRKKAYQRQFRRSFASIFRG